MFCVERCDLGLKPIAVLAQSIGMAGRFSMFLLGDGCFRHQGAESCVVSLVGELDQLFLGDAEIVTRRPEPFAHTPKPALDLGPRHDAEHRLATMRSLRWILAAVLLLAGCGSDLDAGCTELREPEDPTSGQHVLPDGQFDYLTHPPTSGAHVAGPTPSGISTEPLPLALQVRLLEAGGVMVQYDPSVDASELMVLAGKRTVIAPGDDLPAPVIATAWTWKLSCAGIDVEQIERFAAARRTAAPGLD